MIKARMFFGLAMSAALICGASLSACTATVGGPSPNGIAVAQLSADKALAEAHITYNTLTQAALAGIQSGLITGANKAKVKELDNVVYDTLQKADAATDVVQKAALAAQATGLLGQMQALVPASLTPK